MKDMTAFSPYCAVVSDEDNERTRWTLTEWTIITWYLTCRAATFVRDATYTANVAFTISFVVIRVSGVPPPLSNSVP
jgi:hypothetical protein